MKLRIGIDATNIREGGGLHHLRDVLSNFNRSSLNIKDVIIWTNNSIINELPKFDWIRLVDVNDQISSWIGLLKWQLIIFNLGCSINLLRNIWLKDIEMNRSQA